MLFQSHYHLYKIQDLTSRIAALTKHINEVHKDNTPKKITAKKVPEANENENEGIENLICEVKPEPLDDFVDSEVAIFDFEESNIEIKEELNSSEKEEIEDLITTIKNEPLDNTVLEEKVETEDTIIEPSEFATYDHDSIAEESEVK